jgi:hypothetical protein
MRRPRRSEVLHVVRPARTEPTIPIEQADEELRFIAVFAYVAGIATPFVVFPLIGLLFF